MVWFVETEALSDPGSIVSEHDPALSVNAEGSKPQGVWDGRPDHFGKISSPAEQGMVLTMKSELLTWAHSPMNSLLPIALPQLS